MAVLDSHDHSKNTLSVDGVDDTDSLSAVPDSEPINMSFNADFHIGGKDADYYNLSSESFFDGSIDDIRVYNRKLTAPQIASLHGTGEVGVEPVITYSIRWYGQP